LENKGLPNLKKIKASVGGDVHNVIAVPISNLPLAA